MLGEEFSFSQWRDTNLKIRDSFYIYTYFIEIDADRKKYITTSHDTFGINHQAMVTITEGINNFASNPKETSLMLTIPKGNLFILFILVYSAVSILLGFYLLIPRKRKKLNSSTCTFDKIQGKVTIKRPYSRKSKLIKHKLTEIIDVQVK